MAEIDPISGTARMGLSIGIVAVPISPLSRCYDRCLLLFLRLVDMWATLLRYPNEASCVLLVSRPEHPAEVGVRTMRTKQGVSTSFIPPQIIEAISAITRKAVPEPESAIPQVGLSVR